MKVKVGTLGVGTLLSLRSSTQLAGSWGGVAQKAQLSRIGSDVLHDQVNQHVELSYHQEINPESGMVFRRMSPVAGS